MKLKLDAEGKVVVQDDKPVYVDDNGKDIVFDAPGTVATISRLNAEAKGHRERAEASEATLKKFEGITDPAAALKALETVSNLDSKKLVDAGEVQKVKDEAIKAVRAEFEPVVTERDSLKNELYSEKIGGSFSRSKVIQDKFAIPADFVQARFGSAFSIEDGKIVAKDHQGNKLYSKSNPGEPAGFDEALEMLVDAYPHKDQILKPSGSTGGGSQGGGGGGGSTKPAGNFGGTKQERAAAIAQQFPDLPKG